MAEAKEFEIQIITPDRIFFQGHASMIEFNTTEGEIGCYPMHVPTTVVLAPGVVTIHGVNVENEIPQPVRDDGTLIAAVHAGFAEILPDSFSILAEAVEWPDEIDEERARAAMERAKKRLESKTDDIDMSREEMALQRAITRINALK